MSNDKKLYIYPSLDTSLPKIPERNCFYSLEPIGVGTPYCESLVSYITRLADEHCVSPKKLLEEVSGKKYEFLTPIIKIDENILANLILDLERLTNVSNLRCLTMLNWSNVFRFYQLYKQSFSWCPICYEEWKQQNKPLYWPIIWLIDLVNKCPIHNLSLIYECFKCGYLFNKKAKIFKIGYCPQCKSWLGHSAQYKLTKYEDDLSLYPLTQKYIVKNLADLISFHSPLNYFWQKDKIIYILRCSLFIKRVYFLSTSLNISANSREELIKKVYTNSKKLFLNYELDSLPTLKKLLNLIHFSNISLRDFIFKDADILIREIVSNSDIAEFDTILNELIYLY